MSKVLVKTLNTWKPTFRYMVFILDSVRICFKQLDFAFNNLRNDLIRNTFEIVIKTSAYLQIQITISIVL